MDPKLKLFVRSDQSAVERPRGCCIVGYDEGTYRRPSLITACKYTTFSKSAHLGDFSE